MSAPTASIDSHAATVPDASAPATAAPTDPKVLITGAVVLLLWGPMTLGARGSATSDPTAPSDLLRLGAPELNARLVTLTAVGIVAAATAVAFDHSRRRCRVPIWAAVLIGVGFVLVFPARAGVGSRGAIPLVTILSSALGPSVPLAYGLLVEIIGERLGTINIATEGQFLGGVFLGAAVASACSNPWAGILAAPVTGVLVALPLALFDLRHRVDRIVVGVVFNVLIPGLTGSLSSTSLSSSPSLNRALRLSTLAVPLLFRILIIGPVLFRQTILVHLIYAAVAALSVMLPRFRWGLRLRACGEYLKAADTVDINVMRTRVANLALAGALAGLRGTFLTVGSGLSFENDVTAGNGYIVLVAMTPGAWRPLGSPGAVLLFSPAAPVAQTLPVIGSSVSPSIISMILYIVTILAVAGFVGKVHVPATEGVSHP